MATARSKAGSADALLATLAERYAGHPARHPGLAWATVAGRLASRPAALRALQAMEDTGGEPDVVGPAAADGSVTFVDCSAETPAGRRSLCYDEAALASRKEHRPAGSAVETAAAMGVRLLTEAEYRALQTHGVFDARTSSWIATPDDVRALGGALFCDHRYGRVFTYHNGAPSYYAVRGFRAALTV